MDPILDIKPIIESCASEISRKLATPEKFISIVENEDSSISVWLSELTTGRKTKLAFKVSSKGRKGQKYLSFSVRKGTQEKITLSPEAVVKKQKSKPLYADICFPCGHSDFGDLISQLISYAVETFEPSDKYGCCDKYSECSRAGKCLHDNLFYAKACWYRKNLEKGNIFY